ncbi:MAG TPA: cytochrome C' [Rhodocyclaceae bacterium]|nr:MAG: hypothetical protein AUK49_10190 [Betaproteobacteria bacterium CG2_30_68_42]PIV76987.1 MAG: cytochrome C' [Rhodocyclales bacterium CG17_big_fil_post_rev_8_21_14_2_50_68_7]PIX76255.1 MAG: cytochrome C' [Rhodocyclales bacterium CG_4_10_14_3_um_filter_68_10]PJA56313.1 MAG: cytochrome C' [Rhodocyclales bacterium CG_4_9_14_3_um_filter_68_10]HCX32950.1 cytochrome C' [Rhodocyclaceae bacterium]
MKSVFVPAVLGAAAIALLASASARAADESALAKAKNCLACHTVDKKLVGPAYKEVAKKYKGQNVVDKLAEKVRKGGVGVWGQIPMPPNAVVNEAESKRLVQWVLSM